MSLVLYKLDSGNACTFGGTSINSVVDWNMSESASTTDLTSDGVGTIQGVVVDNQAIDVTITTKNPAQFNSINVGDCGVLVLKGISRTCGDGTSTALTATSAESVTVVSIDRSVPHEGDSAGTITFRCGNSTGAAIFAYS